MQTLWQDLRYGARMLFKNSAFTLIAVTMLALGIGANTAVFSVINRLILNPMPFKDGERMVYLRRKNARLGNFTLSPSVENILAWRQQAKSFEAIEGFIGNSEYTLMGGTEPEAVNTLHITPGLLPFLGVTPKLGRGFTPEEAKAGAEKVVIISDEIWQRRFGGDPQILGKQITLKDNNYTVIGVLPAKFRLLFGTYQIWLPANVEAKAPNGGLRILDGIAKLKPGVTATAAQAELDVISKQLEEQDPKNKGWRAKIMTPQDNVGEDVRKSLPILFIAVGVVLLIACANVANLVMARNNSRAKEVAIRLALGASRWQLIRQLLTESLLLALLAGGAGTLLAFWGLDAIIALRPETLLQLENVQLDRTAMGFTLAISLFTGLLFGLLPAWQSSRANLSQALKQGTQTGETSGRQWTRSGLVIVEVALSLVLLVGAGLLIRSFAKVLDVDVGFKPENLLAVRIELPQERYPTFTSQTDFYQRLVTQLRQLPGVQGAEMASGVPPITGLMTGQLEIEGRTLNPAEVPGIYPSAAAGQDFFKVLGLPIKEGRAFNAQDNAQAPETVIINEALAQRFWPHESPLGKHMRISSSRFGGAGTPKWRTIVGVVGNVKIGGLESSSDNFAFQVYLPQLQSQSSSMLMIVRTDSTPTKLLPLVKEQVRTLDNKLPVKDVTTVEKMFGELLGRRRFNLVLLSIFAGLAIVLSALGIYGLLAYLVSQSTREIGIRLALGAQPGNIFKLIVSKGMLLAIAGIIIGLGASLGVTRFLSSLLFGISPTDGVTFAGTAGLLGTVALLACYLPARRATKVDPMVALRYE